VVDLVIRRLPLVLVLVGVGGCMVGPDYRAPTPEAQVGRIGSGDTADAESAGVVAGRPVVSDWWKTLNDRELDSLVELVVDENLDVKTAMAKVREARALRGVAASPLYPSLTLGGDVGLQGNGDQFHSTMTYNPGLNLDWQIDVFGGLRRGVESANAAIDAAIESRRGALVTALGDVGLNYVELRGEQRQLAIAKTNVALQEKSLALVQIRRKSGLASDLEIAQASALLETTRATVPALEQQIAQSIFRLSVLVGREPSALTSELSAPGPIPALPPTIPIGLSSELLLRRPDLRKVERNMEVACANLGVAVSELYPKFALTGNINYEPKVSEKTAGQPVFFVGPSITLPIFNGFAIVENIHVMDARLEQAVLGYRSGVLVALQDVESSVTAYAKETVRRDVLRRAEVEARKAEQLAEVQYKNGLVDFLNVIQAESTLAGAQQSLVTSEQTCLTDLIAVYRALGGGWDVYEGRLVDREAKPAETELPK
jgi:NodT family efflux transporter outer membrane factor (OMF) lipoprotein